MLMIMVIVTQVCNSQSYCYYIINNTLIIFVIVEMNAYGNAYCGMGM